MIESEVLRNVVRLTQQRLLQQISAFYDGCVSKKEVAFFTRYSLPVSFYWLLLALLLVTRCAFTCYSLRFYLLLVGFLLVTRCVFTST